VIGPAPADWPKDRVRCNEIPASKPVMIVWLGAIHAPQEKKDRSV